MPDFEMTMILLCSKPRCEAIEFLERVQKSDPPYYGNAHHLTANAC